MTVMSFFSDEMEKGILYIFAHLWDLPDVQVSHLRGTIGSHARGTSGRFSLSYIHWSVGQLTFLSCLDCIFEGLTVPTALYDSYGFVLRRYFYSMMRKHAMVCYGHFQGLSQITNNSQPCVSYSPPPWKICNSRAPPISRIVHHSPDKAHHSLRGANLDFPKSGFVLLGITCGWWLLEISLFDVP